MSRESPFTTSVDEDARRDPRMRISAARFGCPTEPDSPSAKGEDGKDEPSWDIAMNGIIFEDYASFQVLQGHLGFLEMINPRKGRLLKRNGSENSSA